MAYINHHTLEQLVINVEIRCKFCDTENQCLLVKGVICSGTADERKKCPEWSVAIHIGYVLDEFRDKI